MPADDAAAIGEPHYMYVFGQNVNEIQALKDQDAECSKQQEQPQEQQQPLPPEDQLEGWWVIGEALRNKPTTAPDMVRGGRVCKRG